MTTRDLALVAHLLGVILWIGGTLAASTVGAFAVDAKEGSKTALLGARRVMTWWSTPGMLLAWAGGLTMLIPDFTTSYAGAGWMHTKLALLLALSGITGVLSARLRKAASGEKDVTAKILSSFGMALVVIAFVVLVLVVLKPGSGA